MICQPATGLPEADRCWSTIRWRSQCGSIANLAPDYIKLDISLISNIDSNFLKQNLVETMVSFAESQGAQVIAEGVERREEFETVKDLGVHLTQGFLFHRPRYAGPRPPNPRS